MAKLFKLKEWLTLPDAAGHLTIVLGEPVSEADLLRLVLDRHLTLSVNFVNHATAKIGKVISLSEAKTVPGIPVEGAEPYLVTLAMPLNDREGLVFDEKYVRLTGVWDLPMIGAESLDIEHRYQKLTGGPSVTLVDVDGAFVAGADGRLYQIQDSFDKARDGLEGHYPAAGLPDDGVLVVRTEALRTFEQSMTEPRRDVDRPLLTRERRTLLTIVAALGSAAKIDLNSPGAVQLIKAAGRRIGVSVSDDTIRKILDEVPEALEARQE